MSLGNVARRSKEIEQSREWIRDIDVVEFLEELDLNNVHRSSSDEMLFSCPFDGHSSGDSKPSAYMNTGELEIFKLGLWQCHGCDRKGDIVSFYSQFERISRLRASTDLRARFSPNWRPPKGGTIAIEFEQFLKEHEEKDDLPALPEILTAVQYEKKFAVDWQEAHKSYVSDPEVKQPVAYLFDRGFTVKTLQDWDVGYDEKKERLVLPVRDINGKIVGLKGRTWKKRGHQARIKYLNIGDREGRRKVYGFPSYSKAEVVFGIDWFRRTSSSYFGFDEGKTAVLVEGELDVLALYQIGIPALSTGSAHLSETQENIIRDFCDRIICFYDWDNAGKNSIFGYKTEDGVHKPGIGERLSPFIRVDVAPEHELDASKMVELGKIKELKKLLKNSESWFRATI